MLQCVHYDTIPSPETCFTLVSLLFSLRINLSYFCIFGCFCRGIPIGPCTTHQYMLLIPETQGQGRISFGAKMPVCHSCRCDPPLVLPLALALALALVLPLALAPVLRLFSALASCMCWQHLPNVLAPSPECVSCLQQVTVPRIFDFTVLLLSIAVPLCSYVVCGCGCGWRER